MKKLKRKTFGISTVKKSIFCLLGMGILIFFACDTSGNNNNNGLPPPVTQVINNVGSQNTFSNGDVVTLADFSGIASIKQVRTRSTESAVLSNIRDFSFDFIGVHPSPFSFSVSMTLPKEDNWQLSLFADGAWTELENVKLENNIATTELNVSEARLAFIKTNEFIYDDEVTVNPYIVNPLGALIEFKSLKSIRPTMRLVGQDDNDIVVSFSTGQTHSIDVLGLYHFHNKISGQEQWDEWINRVYLDLRSSGGTVFRKAFDIKAEALWDGTFLWDGTDLRVVADFEEGFKTRPEEFYIILHMNNTTLSSSPNTTVPPGRLRNQNVVDIGFDQYGKVRWMNTANIINPLAELTYIVKYQGRNVMALSSNIPDNTTEGRIDLRELTGELIRRYICSLPADIEPLGFFGFRHDVATGPDNSLIVQYRANPGRGIEPPMRDESTFFELALDGGTPVQDVTGKAVMGNITRVIDIGDFIDKNRYPLTKEEGVNDGTTCRTHVNSGAFNVERNTFLFSARYQGVMEFRRGEGNQLGELVWWLTPDWRFSDDTFKNVLLTPTNFSANAPFQNNWNLGQHAASYSPDGNYIIMFDNQNGFGTGLFYNQGGASRVWVVQINREAKTVTQIHEWRPPGPPSLDYLMGNAYFLPSGDILSGWPVRREVYETTMPGGDIRFSVRFEPAENKTYIYRALKVPLYD